MSTRPRKRNFLRDNGLSLCFGGLFLVTLVAQAFIGHADYNNQRAGDGLPAVSFGRYVTSSAFGVDVMENWQSEYLQFLLYIWVTVWLVQRGSPESKQPADAGTESDSSQRAGEYADSTTPLWARAGGWRTAVYSRSLGSTMAVIFVLCWLVQSVTGRGAYNRERAGRYQPTMDWSQYIVSADFWNRTVQNWQSEFLAVGSMAALSIFLRQRGSPESKPVGAAHGETDVEG